MAEVMERVFIHPGEIYVSDSPIVISTVLGSCISIIFWDRIHRVGGMNHFVLPHNPVGDSSCRYGDAAIRRLISMMKRKGSTRGTLDAYIAGGGNPVRSLRKATSIGEENAAMARDMLVRLRIPIIKEETGGRSGRKVMIDIGSGKIHIRSLEKVRTEDWFDDSGKPNKPPSSHMTFQNRRTDSDQFVGETA